MTVSGRDFYAAKYADDIEHQARWLKFGAVQKAQSVYELSQRIRFIPRSVLEVGAGTGAVISKLRSLGFGSRHGALDYSAEALSFLRNSEPEVETIQGDVTALTSPLNFDLVICTHVLEHLEFPALALDGIARNITAEYYVFEVPLEDLPMGRLRNSGAYRRKNPAGHVQFFNAASFRELIEVQFEICEERIYHPDISAEAFEFMMKGGGTVGPKRFAKFITQRFCPAFFGPLWTRYWYAHMALLARRRHDQATRRETHK